MAKITISQAITWKKVLHSRHAELVKLRDANSSTETRYYGADANKEKRVDPIYDARHLDQMITRLAREIRLVDDAIKQQNATTELQNYDQNDTVLGELEMAAAAAKPAKRK